MVTHQPKQTVKFPLPLTRAKRTGTYMVKLTALTDKGERLVGLVDYTVK